MCALLPIPRSSLRAGFEDHAVVKRAGRLGCASGRERGRLSSEDRHYSEIRALRDWPVGLEVLCVG